MENMITALPAVLLILARLSSFLLSSPVFSSRNIPAMYKIGLAFFLSLVTYTSVPYGNNVPTDKDYILLILKEVLVGITLGYIATVMMSAIKIAGGLIDIQVGLTIASVIDPQTGHNSSLVGQLKNILSILFFLSINGHHLLIKGIIHSYEIIHIDALFFHFGSQPALDVAIQAFTRMFLTAFLLAAPVVGTLFIIDVALGLVARTVPQMNIFVIGLPVKVIAGFIVMLATVTTFFAMLQKLFEEMFAIMEQMIKILGAQ